MKKHINHRINNTNQSGFGLVGILLVVLVLIGVSGAGYYVWSEANQSNDEDASTSVRQNNETTDDEQSIAQLDNIVQTDLNRIMAEINSYAANNNGRFPTGSSQLDAFEQGYLSELDNHPVSDLPYTINEAKADTHRYVRYVNGVCGEDGLIEPAESPRQVALSIELPSGQQYCIDN